MSISTRPDEQPFRIVTIRDTRVDRCSSWESSLSQDWIVDVNGEERLFVEILEVVHEYGRLEVQGDTEDHSRGIVPNRRVTCDVKVTLSSERPKWTLATRGHGGEEERAHLRSRCS
jgi:hypothetical protein